jgi:hypothetical protein
VVVLVLYRKQPEYPENLVILPFFDGNIEKPPVIFTILKLFALDLGSGSGTGEPGVFLSLSDASSLPLWFRLFINEIFRD